MSATTLLISLLLLTLPLGAALLLAWVRSPRVASAVALVVMGLCVLLALVLAWPLWVQAQPPSTASLPWLPSVGAAYALALYIDTSSAAILVAVCLCAWLVLAFSVAYMRGDSHYVRYCALLLFFCFSMLCIVLAGNLLTLFIGWELVGLSSYLLIGFWHQHSGPGQAAQKAFLVNRIGDALMLGGMALLLAYQGNWALDDLYTGQLTGDMHTLAGLLLAAGALAKSAQLPLSVWLPAAMAGPTPVSALIHAATMVAAGVYLLLRLTPLFTADVQLVLATVGALTAFYGAWAALWQNDIKRVLAFSTISQLGYMVLAVGVGVPAQGMFHLLTHAMFKCGLFLCAGAVIHHMVACEVADAQDMRLMGGLRRQLPWVFVAYCVCAAALVGLPFTAGFLSKDAILAQVLTWGFGSESGFKQLLTLLAFASVGLTAFYMMRQLWLVFLAPARHSANEDHATPHTNWWLTAPVLVLALLSLWVVYAPGDPWGGADSWLLQGQVHYRLSGVDEELHGLTLQISFFFTALGLLAAYFFVIRRKHKPSATAAIRPHWLDVVYAYLIETPFLFAARVVRWVDELLVDGLVRGLAALVVGLRLAGREQGLAAQAGRIDHHLIDALVNTAATCTAALGRQVQRQHSGRLQHYLLLTLALFVVGLATLIYALT